MVLTQHVCDKDIRMTYSMSHTAPMHEYQALYESELISCRSLTQESATVTAATYLYGLSQKIEVIVDILEMKAAGQLRLPVRHDHKRPLRPA